MLTTSPTPVNQLSECFVTIGYQDANGVAYIPTAVSWRLFDLTNGVVAQDWTLIGGTLGTSSTITIPGALNQFHDLTNLVEWRAVIFRITVGSTVVRYDAVTYPINAVPGIA